MSIYSILAWYLIGVCVALALIVFDLWVVEKNIKYPIGWKNLGELFLFSLISWFMIHAIIHVHRGDK